MARLGEVGEYQGGRWLEAATRATLEAAPCRGAWAAAAPMPRPSQIGAFRASSDDVAPTWLPWTRRRGIGPGFLHAGGVSPITLVANIVVFADLAIDDRRAPMSTTWWTNGRRHVPERRPLRCFDKHASTNKVSAACRGADGPSLDLRVSTRATDNLLFLLLGGRCDGLALCATEAGSVIEFSVRAGARKSVNIMALAQCHRQRGPVVVLENIYRLRGRGMPARRSRAQGAGAVGLPRCILRSTILPMTAHRLLVTLVSLDAEAATREGEGHLCSALRCRRGLRPSWVHLHAHGSSSLWKEKLAFAHRLGASRASSTHGHGVRSLAPTVQLEMACSRRPGACSAARRSNGGLRCPLHDGRGAPARGEELAVAWAARIAMGRSTSFVLTREGLAPRLPRVLRGR